MAITTEKFLPMEGWNSVFSEVQNFEVRQSPLNSGYYSPSFFFVRRNGLYTEIDGTGTNQWKTEGDIIQYYIFSGEIFLYDNLGKVYRFYNPGSGYLLEKIYDNIDGLSVYSLDGSGSIVPQRILDIPYLVNIEDDSTVASGTTNDDGSGNVVLKTAGGIFSSGDVLKYIYINKTATTGKYQIRQIVEYIDANTVYLDSSFYDVPNIGAGVELYEKIDTNIVFNNIRNSSGEVLCIDVTSSFNTYFRLFGGNDITLFDGRMWILNSFGTQVEGSLLTGEYEILEPTATLGASKDNRGEKMKCISTFNKYIVCFYFNNIISVIYNNGKDSSGLDIYKLDPIISGQTAITWQSYCIKDGGFYFIGNNKLFYSLSINAVAQGTIDGRITNQGNIIQYYLNSINPNDSVVLYTNFDTINILINNGTELSTIIKYDDFYKGYTTEVYNKKIILPFSDFDNAKYTIVGDLVVNNTGESDLGENISQKIVIYGPASGLGDVFVLFQIKLILGYFGNKIRFKGIIELGGDINLSFFGETNGSDAGWVKLQNLLTGDSLGTFVLGTQTLGISSGSGLEDFSKIGLLGLKIGKRGVYYRITLENIENDSINLGGIHVQYSLGDPRSTPLKNTIKLLLYI